MNHPRRTEDRRLSGRVLAVIAAVLLTGLPIVGRLAPAGAAAATDVALFYDGAYVDTTTSGGGEAYNMRQTLTAQGHTVSTFTGTSEVAWSAALTGKDLLVVPELQNGDLNSALATGAKTAVRNFVQGGGGLIVTMDGGTAGTRMVALLNAVYGYSLAFASFSGSTAALTPSAAAGTPYAGGPASLPRLSAVGAVDVATLPSNAKNIYTSDGGTRVWVTFFTEGNGQIALLGWDWYNAQPVGSGDGGWLDVLDRSVAQVASAGLRVTAASASAVAGGTGTATVEVLNSGDADATSVTASGTVPASLAVTAVSSTQGSCTGGQSYTCGLGTLAAGGSATLTIAFSLDPSTGAGTIMHGVHVSSAEGVSGDGEGVVTVTESAGLAVVAGGASAVAGASAQFTVGVFNHGPSDADGTTVTGTVPAVAAVTSVGSTEGSCTSGQSYSCAVGTLRPGGSATVTISFDIDPSTPAQTVQHTAQASSAEAAAAEDQGSLTIVEVNDLSVTAGGAAVAAGKSGQFTVEVTNDGPSDADATTVSGTVPAAAVVTVVSSSPGSCTSGQSYTCAVGTLAPGASATVTVSFAVDAATGAQTVEHTVHAESAEGGSVDAAGSLVISEENALAVAAGGASVTAGNAGQFTIEVTNHGPSAADGTVVSGTVPAAATVTAVSSSRGSCTTGQSYRCAVGTLAPGGSATVTVRFTVHPSTSSQTIEHRVHTEAAEGASADGHGSLTIDEANELRLAAGGASLPAGRSGMFDVTVTNDGPSDADVTNVSGTVPAAAVVRGVSSPQGSCTAGQSWTCALGTLSQGTSVTIRVEFSVAPAAPAQTLQHRVAATSDEGAASEAAGSLAVSEENELVLVAGSASVAAGAKGDVTVVVTNDGPSNADATTVSGSFPPAAAVTAVSSSQGSCRPGQSYSCAVGTLAPGESAVLSFRFSVDPSTSAHTARHTVSAGSAEGASAGTEAVLAFTEENTLTLTTGGASVAAGEAGRFTFEVTNHGPSDADATVVSGDVPAAVTVAQVSSSHGSCRTGQSYRCGVGRLQRGESATVTVNFSVGSSRPAGAVVHTASASSSEGGLADGQGILTIDEEHQLSVTATGASLLAGGSDDVTVEVTNRGPSDADGVTVAGSIPGEAAVTAVSASQGSCLAGGSWRCSVGTLRPGRAATVRVRFSVDGATRAGTITHVAHARSADGASGDAQAAVVIAPPPPPAAGFGDDPEQGRLTTVARPGSRITVTATGFRPDSEVEVWLHSDPVLLGTVLTHDSGRFTASYDIPSTAEPGRHHIVLQGVSVNGEAAVVRLDLELLNASLPATGAGSLSALGVVLASGGIAVGMVGRRRRRSSRACVSESQVSPDTATNS